MTFWGKSLARSCLDFNYPNKPEKDSVAPMMVLHSLDVRGLHARVLLRKHGSIVKLYVSAIRRSIEIFSNLRTCSYRVSVSSSLFPFPLPIKLVFSSPPPRALSIALFIVQEVRLRSSFYNII